MKLTIVETGTPEVRELLLAVISILSLFGAAAQSQQVQFSAPVAYAVGNSPQQVVVADLNGDGKQDLVVLNAGDQTISVLLGNGDGTFQPAVSHPTGSSVVSTLAVGDLNGDGKPDIAVSNGSANSISILLGNGDGSFQAPVEYNLTSSADYVAIADFSGDQKPDLLVATGGGQGTSNQTAGTIAILLGNGDGTFQTAKTTTTGSNTGTTAFVAIGDFNGDGKPDVATGNAVLDNGICCSFTGNIIVLLGNGDGTLQAPLLSGVNGPAVPNYLAAADFRGQHILDLAEVDTVIEAQPHGPAFHYQAVSSATGTGKGTFSSVTGIAGLGHCQCGSPPRGASNIAVADVDGDGKLDLVFPVGAGNPAFSNAFMVVLGNGDGTFQQPQSFNLSTPPSWLATGDFNGDTLPDIVITNSNSVSVFLNTTPSSTLSIVLAGNGGGAVTSQPAVLSCTGSCAGKFAPGTTVTLAAAPDNTSNFTGWGGACSGASTCTVNMAADNSVTATFTAAPVFLLSASLAGNGGGSVTSTPAGINCGAACSTNFATGRTVALSASPNSTSNFTGWSGACNGTGSCSVTMNAAESVTANFSLQDFSLTPALPSLTVQKGAQTSEAITLAGIKGPFASAIQLSCSVVGPTPQPSCAFSPTSVTPGSGSATSTLTITASQTAAMQWSSRAFAVWFPLAFGLTVVGASKRRGRGLLLGGFFLLLILSQVACGGGGSKTPPPTNYTVTVTGASGAIQHTAQVTVTVP